MPINIKGWHVELNNSHKIGIVLMGNFHNGTGIPGNLLDVFSWIKNEGYSQPTSEQIESLRQLIKVLHYKFGINCVGGHKDFWVNGAQETECPGNIAYPILQNEAIMN